MHKEELVAYNKEDPEDVTQTLVANYRLDFGIRGTYGVLFLLQAFGLRVQIERESGTGEVVELLRSTGLFLQGSGL